MSPSRTCSSQRQCSSSESTLCSSPDQMSRSPRLPSLRTALSTAADRSEQGVPISPNEIFSTSVRNWSVERVGAWLMSINPSFTRYAALFHAQHVDGARLQQLAVSDLESLCVHSVGHRIIISAALAKELDGYTGATEDDREGCQIRRVAGREERRLTLSEIT